MGSGGSAPFVAKPLPKLTLAAQQFFQQDPSSTSTTGRVVHESYPGGSRVRCGLGSTVRPKSLRYEERSRPVERIGERAPVEKTRNQTAT